MSVENKDYSWIPSWVKPKDVIFGYPDSLVRSRTAKAYEFAIQKLDVLGKRVLDYGSGFGHGTLRIALNNPSLLISTAKLSGALITQRNIFSRLPNSACLGFARTLNQLPFIDQSFDVIFLHHVIEHVPENKAVNFVEELKRVLKSGGVLSIATPNAEEIIKPEKYGKDYSKEELESLLSPVFAKMEKFSLIPNLHALEVHRRKQLVARIPGTKFLRDSTPPALWENLYGSSGRKNLMPSDLSYIGDFDSKAIDFLVFCEK